MKKHAYLLVFVAFFATGTLSAHNLTDTSKKPLLAVADKANGTVYVTKEANIIFPEILKGCEEETIEYIENFSKKRRDYIIRMYTKGKKVFPKVTTTFKKHGVPEEFKVLIALESAFNANAVSGAGAVGYWQIMDEVAKEYNMKFVPQLTPTEKKKMTKKDAKAADSLFKVLAKQQDDRKNFQKSTQVAARYLRDRRRNLNDNWLLIVASYNCGVGNVWEAMQKSGKENPTFWEIKKFLPAETQAYVMNFITLNVLFHNYDKFVKNTLTFYPEQIAIPDNFEKNISDAMEENGLTSR